MEGIIVLYASAQHFNTMIVLASYIAKHHPSIPVTILSSADASVSAGPSITYRRLPTVVIPPNSTTHPVEGFFELYRLQNPALRVALEEISQRSRIRAFVIDFFCNYAVDVSASLEIPTYFYVSSGVPIVCLFLYLSTIDETVATDLGDLRDFVDIPGLPTIHSSDLPDITFFRRSNVYKHTLELSKNMQKSCGILTNGFDALDFRAKEALANGLCVPKGPTPPVYFIGPLLAGGDAKTGGGEHECLRWLDEQPSKSVIFLCFGRRGFFSGKQLKEMALGLERSGHSFLWSVRNPPGKHSAEDEPDLKELLPEGFLERTQGRGFVVKTWAPQKEVLSHGAVGGFVTHCGRTSIMEAVANGIPMIGWPLNAEQRMNRVIMVEDKLALPLEEEEDGFVTAAELEKRVRELMGSENGRDVRHRIGKMKISAAAAMQENGTSVVALKKFIDSAARD